MKPGAGALTLVLHTHLPWVLHHGHWPHGMDWLSEAVAECYLPLLGVLEPRARPGQSLGVSIGLTPVLCEQWSHPDFTGEFLAYLAQKSAAARADETRFGRLGAPREAALAQRWLRFYQAARRDFEAGPDLVARFAALEALGAIEIMSSGATHGYLPLLGTPAAVRRQIAVARAAHRHHFGRDPRGFWLPECAYRPAGPWRSALDPGVSESWRAGIEEMLAAEELRHVFIERHLVEGGTPLSVSSADGAPRGVAAGNGVAARAAAPRDPSPAPAARSPGSHAAAPRADRAYRLANSRLLCFGRDGGTSQRVWSREAGYPGDPAYLDFHQQNDPGGLRYWAVTDATGTREPKHTYDPAAARLRVRAHAGDFLAGVADTLLRAGGSEPEAHVCAMYDTELFGHWWSEGPAFLAAVLDRAPAFGITLRSAEAQAASPDTAPRIDVAEGSWGAGGDHRVWLNAETHEHWDDVHRAEMAFEAVARRAMDRVELRLDRVLRQAAREVLLLEASDWPFLITHRSAADYARARARGHAADAMRLTAIAARLLDQTSAPATSGLADGDEAFVAVCEKRDSLFAGIDWRAGLVPRVTEAGPVEPVRAIAAVPRAHAPASRHSAGSSAPSSRRRAGRRRAAG